MKRKWYLQTWFIFLLSLFWPLIIPGIAAFILLVLQYVDAKKQNQHFLASESSLQDITAEKNALNEQVQLLQNQLDELGADTYLEVKNKIDELSKQHSEMEQNFSLEMQKNNDIIARLRNEITELEQRNELLIKQIATQERKLQRAKELYKSVDYCITHFIQSNSDERLSALDDATYDEFSPSVILKLHCMDIKSLRKTYRENEKAINHILELYAARYTTKANQTIYQLMVIALRAELQNVLYNLKYEKLEQAIDHIKNITAKYLQIAGAGNQSIAGTLTRFIGEIEYLFIDAVKIEYNYYVKKEQARQEQLALKQQMREEAEERKALELQRKKIAQEESKYQSEIQKNIETLATATDDKLIADLKAKILELQGQLSDVSLKKEEISKLQNGKAGNVYIISNLGSFGENVFKIGMTRRLNPQDRVDELGSASVPFRFDVHSFIFSDDAVALENKLHSILNDKRVNKVNMRKEFFYSSLDELENLVNELDPTAEFNRTMLAEEFRQSQSTDTPYTTDYEDVLDGDEED